MNEVIIREIVESDISTLYLLRNHPEIREFMFDKKPLNYSYHCDYWMNRIESKIPSYVILFNDFIVGFIKLDKKEEEAYSIGIVIMPEFQGRGCGKLALSFIKTKYPNLIAEILPHNEKSINLFESQGFHLDKLVYRTR